MSEKPSAVVSTDLFVSSPQVKPTIKWSPAAQGTLILLGFTAFILVLWQVAADHRWINGFLIGSPAAIYREFFLMLRNGTLLQNTVITVEETVAGFLFGTVLGSALGLLLWFSPVAARVLEPISVAFNGIPKIALAPLIIIWFGAGIESKILLAFASTVTVALLAAYDSTRQLDPDLVNLLRTFGASRARIFHHLIVPSSLPWLISAMRLNVGFALVGAVIGEFISSQKGIGHEVFVAGNLFELNQVWVGVVTLTLLAGALYLLVNLLEKAVIHGHQ